MQYGKVETEGGPPVKSIFIPLNDDECIRETQLKNK